MHVPYVNVAYVRENSLTKTYTLILKFPVKAKTDISEKEKT